MRATWVYVTERAHTFVNENDTYASSKWVHKWRNNHQFAHCFTIYGMRLVCFAPFVCLNAFALLFDARARTLRCERCRMRNGEKFCVETEKDIIEWCHCRLLVVATTALKFSPASSPSQSSRVYASLVVLNYDSITTRLAMAIRESSAFDIFHHIFCIKWYTLAFRSHANVSYHLSSDSYSLRRNTSASSDGKNEDCTVCQRLSHMWLILRIHANIVSSKSILEHRASRGSDANGTMHSWTDVRCAPLVPSTNGWNMHFIIVNNSSRSASSVRDGENSIYSRNWSICASIRIRGAFKTQEYLSLLRVRFAFILFSK